MNSTPTPSNNPSQPPYLEGRYADNLNRTCEPCRMRKIRCEQTDPPSPSGKCMRCEKKNLTCIFHAPRAKRRRVRTDVKVAELERELRNLRERFEEKGDASSSASAHTKQRDIMEPRQYDDELVPESLPIVYPQSDTGPNPTIDTQDGGQTQDVEIDESTAKLLFTKFTTDLAPHFPFLKFPIDISVAEFQLKKPILSLAILSASAASLYPPLGQALASKLEKLYAHHVVVEGDKSLEIVQALLISAVWYHPPDSFSSLKFTQYAHMAANMALDLRLGGPRSFRQDRIQNRFSAASGSDDHEGLRTLLACYILCSG
jgi:hypothetical protein